MKNLSRLCILGALSFIALTAIAFLVAYTIQNPTNQLREKPNESNMQSAADAQMAQGTILHDSQISASARYNLDDERTRERLTENRLTVQVG